MGRCVKFHHAMDADWNFCGMSDTSISYYKHYRETVKKLVAQGLDEDFVYEHFKEGPDRVIASIKDDETRTKALAYVSSCLHRKETVTEGDVRKTLKSWRGEEPRSCPAPKKNLTNVKSVAPDNDVKTQNSDDEKPDPAGEVLADRLKDIPHGSSEFHTAAEELKAKQEGIAGTMEFPGLQKWTPATCKTGPCPDGKTHAAPDKVRGICCDLTGQPVNQISECPYLERQKRAAAQAASGPAVMQARPIINERPPVNVIPVQLTKAEAERAITSIIRGYFTPKSREQWEQVKKAGKWDTDLEALEGLRDDAAERIA